MTTFDRRVTRGFGTRAARLGCVALLALAALAFSGRALAAQTDPPLLTAANFAVLGGTPVAHICSPRPLSAPL
jgi:hypothetical protein